MGYDYKGIFAQEFDGEDFNHQEFANVKKEFTFSVKVVHRQTKEEVWSGTVEANSSKGAQQKWRDEYADIRRKYTHAYCLMIAKK